MQAHTGTRLHFAPHSAAAAAAVDLLEAGTNSDSFAVRVGRQQVSSAKMFRR